MISFTPPPPSEGSAPVPSPGPGHPHQGHFRSIPRSRPPEAESRAERKGRLHLPRELEGLLLVVVDDDESSLAYFATALQLCGAAVRTASNALDAFRLVRLMAPDAVLSDIAMAQRDGYWLIGEIRHLDDEAARQVPVIAMTAFSREHSRDRALSAGFTDALMKPIDPETLCHAIARAVGR